MSRPTDLQCWGFWTGLLIFVIALLAVTEYDARLYETHNPHVTKEIARKESLGSSSLFGSTECIIEATDGTAVIVGSEDYLRAKIGKRFTARKHQWK